MMNNENSCNHLLFNNTLHFEDNIITSYNTTRYNIINLGNQLNMNFELGKQFTETQPKQSKHTTCSHETRKCEIRFNNW